jgi:hypothetical protein
MDADERDHGIADCSSLTPPRAPTHSCGSGRPVGRAVTAAPEERGVGHSFRARCESDETGDLLRHAIHLREERTP